MAKPFILSIKIVSIPKGEATNILHKKRGLTIQNRFNPQRGGYKHVGKLDFIISTLCNGVNVFISVHHIKITHSSENSRDKTLSNPSVYPAAARNQLKILPHLNETVSKLNPRIFALKIDGYDFWSK